MSLLVRINTKSLTIVTWIILILWLVVQVIAVIAVQDIPQSSDSLAYQSAAEYCFEHGAWYPMPEMIYPNYPTGNGSLYIFYPGLINLLEIYLMVFGTIKAAFWMNILFNCVTVWSVWEITSKLGGENFAKLAVILLCMYLHQMLIVCSSMSEPPCIALTYLSIALASRRKCGWIASAAVIIGLALYIRTVAILFAVPMLIYMVVKQYRRSLVWTYISVFALTLAGIYSFNKHISGHGFISSTTLGVNMMLGAYDAVRGLYILDKSWDYTRGPEIIGKDVFEIDKECRRQAMEWIRENPTGWLGLSFDKIHHELLPDDYYHFGRDWDNPVFNKENEGLKPIKILWIWYPVFYHLGIYILSAIGLWIRRRHLWGVDGLILLPFLGSLALAVLTIGNTRYNMPFMPVLIYFAAWSVLTFFKNKKSIL